MVLKTVGRWRARALTILGISALIGAMSPVVAHATPQLSIDVTVKSDGTPSFDADDSAGNDSSATNGIVRVNDSITYRVQYGVNQDAGDNTTVKIGFPKGIYMEELPGFCTGAGSALTPETLPTPQLPLSGNSLDSMPAQSLVCNLGNKPAASSDFFDFTAKVSNLVRNGTALPLASAELSADGATTVSSPTVATVTASSRLKWDISKNSISSSPNQGYVYGPTNTACPWDKAATCKMTAYTALIGAPTGGKGAMPATGDVTWTDDVTPEAMYPGLDAGKIAAIKADLGKYGSRVYPYDYFYSAPGPKIGVSGGTSLNSVRDSGKVEINQDGPGQPAKFTVKNADMTLWTYPKQTLRPAGNAIPADTAYAISTSFIVYTPVATIKDFGVEADNTWTLATKNSYTNLNITGLTTADVQTSAVPGDDSQDEKDWNNHRSTTPQISVGTGFSKSFEGVPGSPGNMSAQQFSPSDSAQGEGPAGGATRMSGGITVAPTQDIQSQLEIVGSNPGYPGKISALMCDAWDSSRLRLEARNVPASTDPNAHFQRVASAGAPVWVSGYNNALVNGSAVYATESSQVPGIQVQYSAVPGGNGEASECGEAQGPWYDDPAAVPGNDPDLLARGVYSAVSRVRIYTVLPEPVANNETVGVGVRMVVAISHEVVDSGRPTGDILPNWAGVKRVNMSELTRQELLDNKSAWGRSSYDPANHSGQYGDRLILAAAQVRVDKQVRKGTSGEFSSVPPQVTGGDTAQFQLTPSLTSPAQVPGILKDVWVEDCLPTAAAFTSASISPSVVSEGSTPADAKRPACDEGETYLRWVFPGHEVNKAMEPIVVTTEISPAAVNGTYINDVVVWAEDDASTLEQRTDQAEIVTANLAGIKLQKTALTPVTQVNLPGQTTNEPNKWRVRLTNTLPSPEADSVNNPDVIDVLPRDGVTSGLTGVTETKYSGTFEFQSAAITKGTAAARILYTSAGEVNQDPDDASNSPAGGTTWCDSPAGGTAVYGTGTCPAAASEVTALRVIQPGAFGSGEVLEFDITMAGIGNAEGDVYTNKAFARAAGFQFPVGPIARTERVVSSSIGDRTWLDVNRNGIQDQFDGSDEPPMAGVEVSLKGTDDLGNAVSLSTKTDAQGAYGFPNLRASDAAGYTVTFGKAADGFTQQTAGSDPALDSNADATTGQSAPVVLPENTDDPTVDAGYLASGALTVTKQLEGQGVVPFAGGDEFTFSVVCTLDGKEVLNRADVKVKTPDGATSADSDPITGIPVGSVCVVTETDAADADPQAQPPSSTVTIGWDADGSAGQSVKASLTNYYSAGKVKVTKELNGDAAAVEAAKEKEFTVTVTCQLPDDNGAAGTTVFSGPVKLKGGQSVTVTDATGAEAKLPLGARCFGEETDTGGATSHEVTPGDWANAIPVETNDPNTIAEIGIKVVNTFLNPPEVKVTKEVQETRQEGQDVTTTYRITVTNTGSRAGSYDLSDTPAPGEGISVEKVALVSVEGGPAANAGFDGATDKVLASNQAIEGGASHTFVIEVRAKVSAAITKEAADCTLDAGENGTGLLNRATLTFNGEQSSAQACAPVTPPPPVVSPSPSPSPSPSASPSPSPSPSPSASPKPVPSSTPVPIRPGLPRTGD